MLTSEDERERPYTFSTMIMKLVWSLLVPSLDVAFTTVW